MKPSDAVKHDLSFLSSDLSWKKECELARYVYYDSTISKTYITKRAHNDARDRHT